jgi:hypothetical protein
VLSFLTPPSNRVEWSLSHSSLTLDVVYLQGLSLRKTCLESFPGTILKSPLHRANQKNYIHTYTNPLPSDFLLLGAVVSDVWLFDSSRSL